MKYLITGIFLITVIFSKAQIVNIPDSNFKKILLKHIPLIDSNLNGEIELSEALATKWLFVSSYNISSQYCRPDITVNNFIGLQAFKNIKSFGMAHLQCYGGLDFSGFSILDSVNISDYDLCGNRINAINFNGCTNLTKVIILNLQFNPNQININFDNCVNLENVELSDCGFETLDFRACTRFTSLTTSHASASNLLLNGCENLQTLNLDDIYVGNILNMSGCYRISSIGRYWRINNLIARNCTSLRELNSYVTGSVGFIDVIGCTSLESIDVNESGLANLDLSSCINLKTLRLPHNVSYEPTYINLKNGSTLTTLDFQSNSNPLLYSLNVCVDDFETNETRTLLQNYWGPVNVSAYCTFFPGGNYNTISGKTKLDLASNGCDNTDPGMPSVALRITDTSGNSLIRYTAPSGDYAHYPYKGLFTLRPYFPYPYFNINPASATVAFDTANSLTATRDFCIQPNGIHNDLEISFLPSWPPARPGFDAAYTLLYKNRGTTTLSGNVQVNFDNGKMNFVNASSPVTTQSTGQLIWNYNNLQPFESKTIQVTFNLLPPTVNNIGDTINFLAAITPNTADETPYDNSFILPQRIIGSYDPNDKQCLEGSKLNISKIGDYLHYQIRFQNEGTDTAFNIVVADTLSNKYDWNSFEYLGSSHTADVKLTNNKLEFIFQNIKLPHKAINEPASHGWVAFKIKPKASVVVGDSLNNKAAIYFDFNFPIITNTATTVVTNTSAPVPVKLEYFSVANNNNGHLLQWKAACSNGNANFSIESSTDGIHFNSIGNINTTALRCQLPLSFTNNNPQVGKTFYRLKITDADGVVFYSKILVVGNTKAGIEISAVANNTVYLNSSKQQTIQLKVMAADGKQILAQQQTVLAGSNNFSLQMKHAAKGIYTLILCNQEGEIITKRFLK